ncbi:unknown [Firmicutes bacterium CAG:791]|nr:unknown [Firmicutes bacterium CAG:791]
MGIQRIDDNGEAVSEILNVNAAHHKGFVADNLRGKVFLNFVQDFLNPRDLCGIKVTG